MRGQRGQAELDQGRRQDGSRDDVCCGGRKAHAEDDAGDRREHQGREQHGVCQLDHHVSEDNADTGQGDHADDDACAGAADDDGHGRESGFHHGGRDVLEGEAFLLVKQHDDGHGAGRPQCRVQRGELDHQKSGDQDAQDQQIDPAVLQDFLRLRDIILIHHGDIDELGLSNNRNRAAPVIQERRYHGGDDDGDILLFRKGHHQECAGTHNRRKDLTAGGSHGLNAAGKGCLISSGLHQRNGKCSRTHDIGHGGTVDGTHQTGSHNRGERRTGFDLTGQGNGDIVDEIRASGSLQEGSEHNEHEDNRCRYAHGRTEQAVQVRRQELADSLQGISSVGNGQREIRSGEGIGHKDNGQGRHNVAQRSARALQYQESEGCARKGSHPGGLTETLCQMMNLIYSHPDGHPGENDQRDINDAAYHAEALVVCEFVLEYMLVQRLRQQHNRQRKCKMDAALGNIIV